MLENCILSQTPETLRTKARAMLAMAALAADGIIGAELRTLADRYFNRALELEAEIGRAKRRPKAARPRRPKPVAAAPSSLGAHPGEP
jgi:hypothetical protein